MNKKSGEGSFGIKQLDNISLGSVRPGDFGLIQGPTGTGKSSLALHFLFEGASKGDNVCMITSDSVVRLKDKVSSFSRYDPKWLNEGYLFLFGIQDMMSLIGIDFYDPDRGDLTLFNKLLIETIESMDIKRLVIDPLGPVMDWAMRFEGESFITQIKRESQKRSVMAMMVLDCQYGTGCEERKPPEFHDFDIIIELNREYEKTLSLNTLRIKRWSSALHSKSTYVLDISEDGVIIVPRIKPMEVR